MATEYTPEENERWAESQRREAARRAGEGHPIRPGEGHPPRPRPQAWERKIPASRGRPAAEPPPRRDVFGAAAKRQLPTKGLGQSAKAAAGRALPQQVDQASVTKATAQGFRNGFVSNMAQLAPDALPDTEGSTDNPALGVALGSPLAALALIAEQAEEPPQPAPGSTSAADREERLERFPELRNVEVATGNAAKFPELEEDPKPPAPPQQESDGDYDR